MSAIIPTSKLLAVQQICGVVLCKPCKLAFPSKRSAKEHLADKHSVGLSIAKTISQNAFNAAEAVLAVPNSLREAYLVAPKPVPGSSFAETPFYRPLEGLATVTGFQCTLCVVCYSSEKGMRVHLSEDHEVTVDEEWTKVEQMGSLKLQSIFNGNKTRYFPVSMATPIGNVLSPPSSVHNTQDSLNNSQQQPSSLDLSDDVILFNEQVQQTFNDIDQALFSYHLANNGTPRSHMNPYLASTKFDAQLREENIAMKTAAQYTGLIHDYSPQESLALSDVKAYLFKIPAQIPDISSAVLQQINLSGEKEFRVVSNTSAEKYARNIARIVICAMRLRALKFVSPKVAFHLDKYIAALSDPSNHDQHSRLPLLHALLASICLSSFDAMDSPRNLFVRHFVMFATIVPVSRNQTDSFRYADSKDISPILAALLYATSCCAVFEIQKIRTESETLRNNSTSSQIEIRIHRKKLSSRMDNILAALNVSNNNAASFTRKTLDLANAISRHEDVDFMFDTCQRHEMCGIVDNVHIGMARLGQIVKHLHQEIEESFCSLLHGAPFPPGFLSHIADIPDHIQDKAPGSSFLTQGNMKLRSRKYAVFLFNQITEHRPSGRALFSPSPTSSPAEVVQVFGKPVNRYAVQQWLATVQGIQDKLLACTHLSSGSPGRATELETLQLFNSEFALRNVYISQGTLTLVTRYCKSRSLTGWDRVIARFPDADTSKHFLTYLVLFRSLETVFVLALYGSSVMKSHLQGLFVQRGTAYVASRIRDVIRGTFHTHNIPIEFNHFRHFSAGMVPIIAQNSPRIIREDIIAEARAIAHLQAGHSPLVAEHNYARQSTDIPAITSTVLDKYRLFSSEWHRSLGLLSDVSQIPTTSPIAPGSLSADALQTVSQSLAATLSQNLSQTIKQEIQALSANHSPEKRSEHPTFHFSTPKRPRCEVVRSPPQRDIEKDLSIYLPSLRKLLRKPDALFRSQTQLMVTQATCDAQHDILAVMPTGSGKTISVLLPTCLENSNLCTVVIVPLAALVEEYVDKCRHFGISVASWADREQFVQVYVISADHNRKDIESFLRHLQNQGRLRRLVLDEAHLIVLWLLFRSSFQRLPYALKCRGHYVQIVLLTATLPRIYLERLLQILAIPSIVLYAQPTVRYNLRFRVINTSLADPFQSNKGRIRSHVDIMTDSLCTELSRICNSLISNNGGRILVFTLYRNEAERLAVVIQKHLRNHLSSPIPVRSYHGAMTHSMLLDTFSFWKSNNSKVKIVVSTSAFGTGLDVPDVRAVFHFGGSNGLLEYVQETGRAGRDGLPAECTVIYNKHYADQHTAKTSASVEENSFSTDQDKFVRKQEWEFMEHYMSQAVLCRKNQLYYHVDDQAPGMCIFDPNSSNCDVCDSYQQPNHTPQPSQDSRPFTLSPMPTLINPISSPLPLSSPLPQNTPLLSNSQNSLLLSHTFGSQPHQFQSQRSDPQNCLPVPPEPFLAVPSPPAVRRRLLFGSSQQSDTTISNFRTAIHSLQNICVACLVIDGSAQLNQHKCRHMKNRCKRCFLLGHQVGQCSTFDPKRKNFCYGCSLSQIKGQNVHKAGEFGMNCFMSVARDLAWMFWAKDRQTQNSIADALFFEIERQRFLQCNDDMRMRQEFYVTWLRTEWDGVPNLVRLVLWWHNASKAQ